MLCDAADFQTQLVDVSSRQLTNGHIGLLQMSYNNRWWYVCDGYISDNMAAAACRENGFDLGLEKKESFGGTNPTDGVYVEQVSRTALAAPFF